MNTIISLMAATGIGSLLSGALTFFLTKRKYGAETDSIEIQNLKAGVFVYTEIIGSLRSEIDQLRKEVKEMKAQYEKE